MLTPTYMIKTFIFLFFKGLCSGIQGHTLKRINILEIFKGLDQKEKIK